MKFPNHSSRIRQFFWSTLCLFLALSQGAYGQSIYPEINVLPPSPNSSQLNKYVDMPVNTFTGIPGISIPIYELKLPQLSLPISLDYHASGLKVAEHASWVGAGWTLNAGGSINRVVKGLPDEFEYNGNNRRGLFRLDEYFTPLDSSGINIFDIIECSIHDYGETPPYPLNTHEFFAQGYYDSEPDSYSYSFPGGSGKFVFNPARKLIKHIYDDTQIVKHPFDGPIIPHQTETESFEWQIKDARGIIYTFNVAETQVSNTYCNNALSPYDIPDLPHQSTWHLTKMERGGNWIAFEYVNEIISYEVLGTLTKEFAVTTVSDQGVPNQTTSFCNTYTTVGSKRLSTITSSDGHEIKFIAGADRLDLDGSKHLEKVEVRKHDELIKQYHLGTDYFGDDKKLKLEKLCDIAIDASDTIDHEFEYFENKAFPAIDSKQQDFWGYYNGAAQNNTLIPSWKDNTRVVNKWSEVSRAPNLAHTQTGALKKIIYPTKGWITFDYELHDYFGEDEIVTYEQFVEGSNTVEVANFEVKKTGSAHFLGDDVDNMGDGITPFSIVELRLCDDSYQDCQPVSLPLITGGNRRTIEPGFYQLFLSTDETYRSLRLIYDQSEDVNRKKVGGLRIRKTSFYDPVKKQLTSKVYEYLDGDQSSGILYTKPYIGGHESTRIPKLGDIACLDGASYKTISLASSISIPISTYQGNHVGYSKVQVINYDHSGGYSSSIALPNEAKKMGYTEYEFINEPITGGDTFPFVPPPDKSHKIGKPLRETYFKYVNTDDEISFQKVREMIYEYNDIIYPHSPKAVGYSVKRTHFRGCYQCFSDWTDHAWNNWTINTKWYSLKKQTERIYDPLGVGFNERLTLFEYGEDHSFHTATKSLNHLQDTILTKVQRNGYSPSLITAQETFVKKGSESVKLSEEQVVYHGVLPKTYKKWNPDVNEEGLLESGLELIQDVYFDDASKVTGIVSYPNTMDKEGLKRTYLWSYQNQRVVAEIGNSSQDEVIALLALDGVSLLQLQALTSTSQIRTVLEDLRSRLADLQSIQIYLYDSPFGPTEIIDANGISTYFSYDAFGRLKWKKDHEGYLTEQYNYNYKN